MDQGELPQCSAPHGAAPSPWQLGQMFGIMELAANQRASDAATSFMDEETQGQDY